jgi:hypothetical protein
MRKRVVRTTICAAAVLIGIVFSRLSFAEDEYVPGDLVVVFSEEDTPMIDVSEEGCPAAYQSLDGLFATYGIEDVHPLFATTSPLRNIYLLRFGQEADLDAIAAGLGDTAGRGLPADRGGDGRDPRVRE